MGGIPLLALGLAFGAGGPAEGDEAGLLDPLAGAGDEGLVPVPGERAPVVRRVAERWTVPGEVLEAVRGVSEWPLGERIEVATRPFLGLPYWNDAAGELDDTDPDPPARYDTFDCLTFVEEALGLVLAADPLGAPAIRDALRYRGPAAYGTRRHFMEAQWIPDAIQNGLLVDITPRVGRARRVEKHVSLDTWRRWRRRGLFQLPEAELPTGPWSLSYLDLAEAEAAVPRIPPGSVLLTIRQPREWSPITITHISLVLPGGRMRHATRMGAQKVRDDRLDWYVRHLRDYVNWPVLGVGVLYPREQGPRVSALQPFSLPDPFPAAEGPLPAFAPAPIAPYPAP